MRQLVKAKRPHWKHKTKLLLLASGRQKIESPGSGTELNQSVAAPEKIKLPPRRGCSIKIRIGKKRGDDIWNSNIWIHGPGIPE